MSLRVDGLRAAYGSRPALQGVTWTFRGAGTTAVVGPSGGGKTTLLKCLNRTLELTPGARVLGGRVLLGGLDVLSADPLDIRKRVGLIHQKPVPFPMSIRENVLFGARFHGLDGRSAEDVARENLERAGLWAEVKDRLDEPAASLSGGQQQRLCIARALANRPDVLLMDEPCSSLDPKATAAVEALIAELGASLSLVLVTHNLAQARRVAQDALVLIDGAVAEGGAAARVLTEPDAPSAREFIRSEIG